MHTKILNIFVKMRAHFYYTNINIYHEFIMYQYFAILHNEQFSHRYLKTGPA